MAFEGMSGMMGACLHRQPCGLPDRRRNVRCSRRHFVAPRFGDHFEPRRKFRGDRHSCERVRAQPARDAQKPPRGAYKILWRMHATPLMAEKRSFQDGCERPSLRRFPFVALESSVASMTSAMRSRAAPCLIDRCRAVSENTGGRHCFVAICQTG